MRAPRVCICPVLVTASPSSPAQGAMYAPLALKYVVSKGNLSCPGPTYFSLRVPAVQISANLTSTAGSPGRSSNSESKSKSHAGAIAGAVIGGVAALLAIGAIALVVWCRWRQSHKRASVGSSLRFTLKELTEEGTQVDLTSDSPSESGFTTAVPLFAGPQTDWQVEPFVRRQSMMSEASPFLSSPTVPVPVGLSDKELAQVRSGGLRSSTSVDGRSPGKAFSPTETSDGDTSGGAATEVTTSSRPEPQSLQTQVDFLMHEVQQLRAERSSEAPPTYVSGVDGDA